MLRRGGGAGIGGREAGAVASDRPAKWLQAHVGKQVAVGYSDGTVIGGRLDGFDDEWLEMRDDGGHRILCSLAGARMLVEMAPAGVALPPRGGGLTLAPRS